jgi:hypothetical protein
MKKSLRLALALIFIFPFLKNLSAAPFDSGMITITQPNNVTLRIYDVLGNEIRALVNEEKSIGNYDVEFNATGLPSGIYFYQLKAGNFVETKKMILLK